MKSILSKSFLAILSFTSLILTPLSAVAAPNPKNDGKKLPPKPAITPNATFIPSAPHFSVYCDRWTNPLPDPSALKGYNVFLLSFLVSNGAVDEAEAFTIMDDATRQSVIQSYHDAGIALMVSAFGSTEAPTSKGNDPIATANTMAAWVKQYGLDGIDVDYEDFNAINAKDGKAEQWLIDFTNQLRSQLPAGQYIITHAPVAPWFTDDTNLYPTGAYHAVAKAVGDSVDWWHLQYYNQGNDYTDCNSLLTTSQSDYPHTSIFEISQSTGISLDKLVIGKPAITTDASTGFVDANTLAGCLSQGKNAGWNGGAMFWQYPNANADLISTVRSQSWPV